MADWSLETTLTEAGSTVNSVAFSPNGDYIAYGSSDANTYVHNTSDWSLETTLTEAGNTVNSVAFSPNGDYIAYGARDYKTYVHNTTTDSKPTASSIVKTDDSGVTQSDSDGVISTK
jgi:WD40 repeat protein